MVSAQPWRALYPFESRWWDRGGLRLHYLDEGRGEPVLMLHGNPTWSFFYRELVKDLRGSHRVIVPDHIGMGLSDKPGDAAYRHTLASRVDDVDGLVARLGLGDGITVIAHDWGGMIGLAWALRRPERVKRLILMNTAGFLLPAGKGLPLPLILARSPLGPLLVQGLNLFSRGTASLCSARPLSPAVRAGYLAPYASWAERLSVLRFVQDIPLKSGDASYELVRSVSDGLHRLVRIPTMILWGAKDFVFDEDFLAEWRRRLPTAEYHRLEDAGHLLLEDAPETAAALVKGFLAREAVHPGA